MPAPAPYFRAPRLRLARQLTVLIAILCVLAGASNNAEAMLCEVEVEETQLMSSVADTRVSSEERVFAWAKLIEATPTQACDALSMDDCDINLPGGEPRPPNPSSSLRPSAALSDHRDNLLAPPPARAHYRDPEGALLAGHIDHLFRPPRS